MLRWLGLWTSVLRTSLPRVAAIAALALVTSLVAASVPRILGHASDDALHGELANASAAARNLELVQTGRIPATGTPTATDPLGPVTAAGATLTAAYPAPLPSIVRETGLAIDTPHWRTTAGNELTAVVRLRVQQDVAAHLVQVDGRLPRAASHTIPDPTPNVASGATIIVFEAAVSAPTAAALAVRVGDLLVLNPETSDPFAAHRAIRLAIDIVGTYSVTDPADPFWIDDADVGRPGIYALTGFTEYVSAVALLAPDAYPALLDATSAARLPMTYRFRSYVGADTVEGDAVDALAAAVRRAQSVYPPSAAIPAIGPGGVARASLHTGLGTILDDHVARWATAAGVLTSAWAGVGLTIAASIALVALAAARSRRSSVAVVRNRGASRARTLAATVAEGFLLVAPGAVAGVVLAFSLVPARDVLPALIAAAAVLLATIALLSAASLRPDASGRDAELTGPLAGTWRRMAVVVAAILAGGGTLLLREPASSGAMSPLVADPALAAVPVLLGVVAGAVLVAGAVPIARAAASRAGRGSGISGALGWRRSIGTAPALLLVALAATGAATYPASIAYRLSSGAVWASWQTVGADLAVSGSAPQVAAFLATPPVGVAASTPVATAPATVGGFGSVTAIIVDPATANAVAGGTPADPNLPPAMLADGSGGLAVLASADALKEPGKPTGPSTSTPAGTRARPSSAAASPNATASGSPAAGAFTMRLGSRDVPITVVGRVTAYPGVAVDGPFIVIARPQLAALGAEASAATLILVKAPGLSTEALQAELASNPALAGLSVTSRADVEAGLLDGPALMAVDAGLRLGSLIVIPYGALAIVVAIVLAASARRPETARLAVLGVSRRQAAGAALIEALPAVLVGTVAGVGLGLAIAAVVLPGLGLGVLVGAPDLGPTSVAVALAGPGLAAAALLVAAAALVSTTVELRPSPSEVIRE
jgi:putative ABC transport system permease protein